MFLVIKTNLSILILRCSTGFLPSNRMIDVCAQNNFPIQISSDPDMLSKSLLDKIKKIPSKRVSFRSNANVVLIPTIDEYHAAGLAQRLWYNEYDFRSFKSSTAKEVQLFLKDKPKIGNKEALKLYCQQLGEDEKEKEIISPVVSAPVLVAEEVVSSPVEETSEEVVSSGSAVTSIVASNNNNDNNCVNNETVENILVILSKELGREEACDVNMSVHIITYERFRSDSLTLPNSRNMQSHNNINKPDADPAAFPVEPLPQSSSLPSSVPKPEEGDGWTVFNLLPEMNQSSETLAILAQLIALVSLTVIHGD